MTCVRFSNRRGLLAALLALPLLVSAVPALAGEIDEPELFIDNMWVRAVPPVSSTTAGYFTVTNTSDETVTLLGFSTDIAGAGELHTMAAQEDGTRRMQRRDQYRHRAQPDRCPQTYLPEEGTGSVQLHAAGRAGQGRRFTG